MRGVVLYSFKAEEKAELTVHEKAIVEIIEENPDGWSAVSYESKIGFIPTAYYEVIKEQQDEQEPEEEGTEEASREQQQQQQQQEDEQSTNKMTQSQENEEESHELDKQSNKFRFGLKKTWKKRSGTIVNAFKKNSPSSISSKASWSSMTPPSKPVVSRPRAVSMEVNDLDSSMGDVESETSSTTETTAPSSSSTPSSDNSNSNVNNSNKKKLPREPRPPPRYSEREATKSIRAQLKVYLIRKRFTESLKDPQLKSCRMRNELIREMLSTERTYVGLLDVFVEIFVDPIKNNPKYQKILDQKHNKLIFSNVEQILKINQMLLGDLEKGMANWPQFQIGPIFKRMAPFLKSYTTYINNFDDAIANFEKLEKNAKFKEFLSECYANPRSGKHNYDSFSILPIQRIPRYKMLLQDILKNTPETHVEYNDLKIALSEISSIASFVNEKKRQKEQSQLLVDLSKLLKDRYPALVQPNRQFVREGKLRIRSQSNIKGINDDFNVYFFSDVIIILDMHEKRKLSKRSIHFIFLGVTLLQEKGKGTSCDFTLDTILDGNKESLVMTTGSFDERAMWEADLESNLEIIQRQLKNRGFSVSPKEIVHERLTLASNASQRMSEYDLMDKEYVTTEKKLQKIEHELSTSEQQLKALVEKIQKQRSEKKESEMQLDELQSLTSDIRSDLTDLFEKIRMRDRSAVSALEQEDAFREVVGEVPSTEESHKAALPQERPQRQHYDSSNEEPNTLVVDEMVIHFGGSQQETKNISIATPSPKFSNSSPGSNSPRSLSLSLNTKRASTTGTRPITPRRNLPKLPPQPPQRSASSPSKETIKPHHPPSNMTTDDKPAAGPRSAPTTKSSPDEKASVGPEKMSPRPSVKQATSNGSADRKAWSPKIVYRKRESTVVSK